MTATRTDILFPLSRLVGGSLYEAKTTDQNGAPRVVKKGPNAGKPFISYDFAIAIAKGVERHWAETQWGAVIWACGHAAFPGPAQAATFAWKVTDGDSQIPNKKGNKPCDNEGYRGHWVIWLTSGIAPRVFNKDGSQQILEPNAVKRGFYVQVFGNVKSNESTESPGVYINHSMVSMQAYGEEIVSGPDAAAVGFGAGVALPPGASVAPLAGTFNPAAPPVTPGAAPIPPTAAYAPPPPVPAAAYTAPPAPVPIAVAPNPAILNVPAPVVAAAPPPPAPAAAPAPVAPARAMTALAGGHSYESLIAAGWTDATLILIQNGYMTA
jgi:hypothetical protein